MQPRPWQEVLDALVALGVEVVSQNERHVVICRGAVKLQYLPKLEMVPGWIQWNIVTDLGFEIAEYRGLLRSN